MEIHGFTKTTLLDYPGRVACTVFTAGCNFRCPFCHNGDLVLHPDKYPAIAESEVFAHLEKRRGILSGVCISGGEPTLQSDILDFIKRIREYDMLIKLDTNGYRPEVLAEAINLGLVDYVAMDIKSSPSGYSLASGIPTDISKIEQSIDILKSSSVPYEFRTTCVKGIHKASDFEEIAAWLPSNSLYFLQSYKENESVPDKSCTSFSKKELEKFITILKEKIPLTSLRGID